MTIRTRGLKAPAMALVMLALLGLPSVTVRANDETEVRRVVQQVFQQLKSRDYGAVYDSLPSATRSRVTRSRFINALQQSQGRYALESLSIGAVRLAGDIAVADTELFGRLLQPFEAEGKIVVQQYVVRENGAWRVVTGDTATIQRFLKSNPTFARKFPIRQPRIFMKQNGKWVEFNMPKR